MVGKNGRQRGKWQERREESARNETSRHSAREERARRPERHNNAPRRDGTGQGAARFGEKAHRARREFPEHCERQEYPQNAPVHAETTAEEDLIWGLNPVLEAFRSGQALHELRIVEGKAGPRLQEMIDAARDKSVPLRFVPASRLGVPQDARHQGVVARLAAVPTVEFFDLMRGYSGPLLVLDCIQDPRNLGSILRSALAAGFDRIILPKERSAILGGTVAKSSAGAVSHLKICRVANIAETLQTLKERGYWIFGAVAEPEAPSLYKTDFPEASCLVIGSEGKGIRPLVRRHCDQLFTIPMGSAAKGFNSLNASAACAIILFEYARRQIAG